MHSQLSHKVNAHQKIYTIVYVYIHKLKSKSFTIVLVYSTDNRVFLIVLRDDNDKKIDVDEQWCSVKKCGVLRMIDFFSLFQ